jgi:hypothetical protein
VAGEHCSSLYIEPVSLHPANKGNLIGAPSLTTAFTDQRLNMKRNIDPLFSASRGTLVGDLLWLGAIGFVMAIITGVIG